MSIPLEVKVAIAQHAQSFPTQEVCGVVLMDNSVIQVQNCSATPETDFEMPPETLPKHSPDIRFVYHSHWSEDSPALLTPADINNARATKVASIVYHTTFDQWDLFDPNGLHPWPLKQRHNDPGRLEFYLGWPWEWGRSDCLTLFRAYYAGMLGLHIDDFDRVESEEEFQKQLDDASWNMYDENLGKQGLEKVFEGRVDGSFAFQKHDVILMQLQGRRPHHVGILVDADKMEMIHHLQPGRLSEVVPYGPGRMRQTHSVWRAING